MGGREEGGEESLKVVEGRGGRMEVEMVKWRYTCGRRDECL